MDDMRQSMGQELSERYTAQQKGTAKMVNDFDKMRKELAKVCCMVTHLQSNQCKHVMTRTILVL